MNDILPPTPGHPSTYLTAPDDRRVVLVPIRDPKRDRTLFAKVNQTSFDGLPESIRNSAWFIVRDGSAGPNDNNRFSVRAGRGSSNQVSVARLVMKAKAGEFVRNVNSDRLDLRTTNLRIKFGALGKRSTRDDLSLVTAPRTATTDRYGLV